MRRSIVLSLPISAMLLGLAGPAGATPITYAMQGTVGTVNDPQHLLNFVQPGDRVTYTFAFDTNAPDLSSLPYLAIYGGLSSTLRVGDLEFPSGIPGMTIGLGSTCGLDVESNFGFQGLSGYVYFRLRDYQGIGITDPSLPLVPYDLSLFETSVFNIDFMGPTIPPSSYPTEAYFYGPADSFYRIPEPTSALLATLSFSVLTGIRHFRRTRRKAIPLGGP